MEGRKVSQAEAAEVTAQVSPKTFMALAQEWKEPTSLHPYRDEKKCAAELEALIREHWGMWPIHAFNSGIKAVEYAERILGLPEEKP